MSAASINQAANDPDLRVRVDALTHKEIVYNAELGDTDFGRRFAAGMMLNPLWWAVAVATEAAYETALLAGRGAPGHDVDVITDGDITSAIIANWPPDPVVPGATVATVDTPADL